MIQKMQDFLEGRPTLHIWLIILGYVIIVVEILVGGIDYMIWGRVTWDYLLTGFLSALPVTALQVQFITHIFTQNEQTKRLNQALENEIAERKAREQELLIAATAFETQEGMIITDVQGIVLRVNLAFSDMTGLSAEEVMHKHVSLLKTNKHTEEDYQAALHTLLRTGKWDGEFWCAHKNSELQPQRLGITAVKNAQGITSHYVATMTDFTMSAEVAEEIKHLAFYDFLTHLPNRRLLKDRLDHAIAACERSGKQGALLYIDLDHFKDLNDTLGHNVGDILLKQVAERLSTSFDKSDTFARIGGDEFVLLLEGLSLQEQEAMAAVEAEARKIRDMLAQQFMLNDREYNCTASVGVAMFDHRISNAEELLKQADIAMYQAKAQGRNQLCFFLPHMQTNVTSRVSMLEDLHKAIEHQAFELYFQPQINASKQIVGLEALIRWHHPTRGLVMPNDFIYLAEESGLIIPIGNWVIESACKTLVELQHDHSTSNIKLAVNVSAIQFHHEQFAQHVMQTVDQYSINPRLLELELTESLLQTNLEDTVTKMHTLRQHGIRFSLDDFGTGYSSLQYLKSLPLDQLKIDQSFVRDLASDISDRTIISTIIAMAQSLGLEVIAEGVETEEQFTYLHEHGCHLFQGYFYSKPKPLNTLREQFLG